MSAVNESLSLREMLESPHFHRGAEIVSTRGIVEPGSPASCQKLAQQLCDDPRIDWVSLTDNPGGNPMLPPDFLARVLSEGKTQISIHLTCKDRNRNGLESAAWQLASEGYNNILAMTGDYPRTGYRGTAKPVFDTDSVGLIQMLRDMNAGLRVPGRKGKTETLPKTDFYIGCAVSPFKRDEAELMTQYFKMLRKISCGADYVVTQLGYDLRKLHEVKLFLASRNIDTPVVGNVYVLTRFVAKMFNRGDIPGCVVSDALLEQVEKYAKGPDKGKQFFRELAARQMATLKHLGFAAGYIGGPVKADTLLEIIDLSETYDKDACLEFAKETQFCQPGEFYLFDRDEATGLGASDRLNPEYLRSLEHPSKSKEVTVGYRMSRRVHNTFFEQDKGYFDMMRRLYTRWEKKPTLMSRAVNSVERLSKFIGYGCKDCGDCSLPDCAYLCPNYSCSKGLRNGPCGGSSEGLCELKDKNCIWARAYERLKHYHETEEMLSGPAIYADAELEGTSAWANTFLGRDHNAKKDEDQKEGDR